MAYPDGAIRAQFSNSSIITGAVEAVYGSEIEDYYGEPTMHCRSADCCNMIMLWKGLLSMMHSLLYTHVHCLTWRACEAQHGCQSYLQCRTDSFAHICTYVNCMYVNCTVEESLC